MFEQVKEKVLSARKLADPSFGGKAAKEGLSKEGDTDRKLLEIIGPRERALLHYFKKNSQIRRKNLCAMFHIKDRAAINLIQRWIGLGLLKRQGSGFRDAYYVLASDYQKLVSQ